MSAIYDNWERLVGAVLKKEQLWQLFHSDSVSISSDSSGFSFCHFTSSLDDVPFCFSNLDDFGGTAPSSIVVEDHIHAPVENLSTPKNSNSKKRDLKIQVPEFKQSYPLPLPPGAMSNSSRVSPPNSAAKATSRQERAENVESHVSPWKKGKFLGEGLAGGIYLGFNSEKGGMCVMKEIPLSSDGEKKQSARMKGNEIALLSCMRHPNIVQYYGSEMVAEKFYIYYEYMSRGTIYMILEQYGRLGEPAIRRYTQQILSGLAYLHSKSIAHGDIKGANILLDPNGIVKLTNFGIEKQIAEKFGTSWLMDSPYWMAPEVIMNPNVRNSAVDIWSLGCTVLEMTTSKPPLSQYDGVMARFKVAHHKELPTIPDHLSDVCKDFLRQCLQWNPLHRATASRLLEHPFVKGLWPLGERILVSTSSGHPAVTNTVKSEGTDHARNPHSGKAVSHSSKDSRSNFRPSDIYTPRSVLAPTSPAGSPLLHPRSPQQFTRRINSTLRTASSSSTPIAAIQHPHLNQPMLHPETFCDFPKQSPNSNSPSYWDPNILRGMFRVS